MKYLILILILIPGGHLLPGQSPDVRSYSEHDASTGDISVKYEYYHDMWSERNVRHGRYTEWASNGNVILDATYEHDELDGRQNIYYLSGEPKELGQWQQDQRHGLTQWYDRKGNLECEKYYRNGLEHGLSTEYFPGSRQVRCMTQYVLGERHGYETTFSTKGEVRKVILFEDGNRRGRIDRNKIGNFPTDTLYFPLPRTDSVRIVVPVQASPAVDNSGNGRPPGNKNQPSKQELFMERLDRLENKSNQQ